MAAALRLVEATAMGDAAKSGRFLKVLHNSAAFGRGGGRFQRFAANRMFHISMII